VIVRFVDVGEIVDHHCLNLSFLEHCNKDYFISSFINFFAAICYECIMTCTSIYPNQELLKTAAQSVGNFLRSKDISLKYIGKAELMLLS